MRLIVADKDPFELEAMRQALESPDLDIVTATDGEEMLPKIMDDPPRVVVAASSLGQMGGMALSRELKMRHDRGQLPDIAVIVLLERRADAWLAAWSRCDAYLTKPVDLDELELLIRELGSRTQPAPA